MSEDRLELFREEILYSFTSYCEEFDSAELDEFIEQRKYELDGVCKRLSTGEFSYFQCELIMSRFDQSKENQRGDTIWRLGGMPYLLKDTKETSDRFRENYIQMFDGVKERLQEENGPINVSMFVRAWREGIYTPHKGRINVFGEREESV